MGINIYIYGTGTAAQRYYDICLLQGHIPYFIAEKSSSLIREGREFLTFSKNDIPKSSHIICANATRDRKKTYSDILSLGLEPKALLVEKPIYIENEQRSMLDSISNSGCRIFTGDQYYYDDLIPVFLGMVKGKNLEITYEEYLGNVTKNRPDSYALDKSGGGAKWTFSHSVFVAVKILNFFDPDCRLESIRYSNLCDCIERYHSIIEYSDRQLVVNNIFSTNSEAKIFNVFDGDQLLTLDFNARKITSDNNVLYVSNKTRIDLIETVLSEFVSMSNSRQYNYSKTCCDLLMRAPIENYC